MVKDLIALAEINSGSLNLAGLDRVARQLIFQLQALEGDLELVALDPFKRINNQGGLEEIPLGKALRIIKRPEAPIKVLLCGHMDTVFPEDSSFVKTALLDNNTLNGPGVADLKGGLVVMITALAALERSPWAEKLGWEILINPDEELGSPGSSPLLAESAGRNHLGLVFEPALPDGGLISERKGSGNFTVIAHGRAVHAGREFAQGRNAIKAISDFIQEIESRQIASEGVTINPGVIQGGRTVNIVPDLAVLKLNIRITHPDDEPWVLQKIHNVISRINKTDGLHLELYGAFDRSPKRLTDGNQRLLNFIADCGNDLGLTITWQATGGCCDGNNLAAAGLSNVDTLGVRGDGIHTHGEFVCLDSLVERARLCALLLMKLASGEIEWRPKP